jgi:sugar phosphate isomerase/epimerase
MPFKIGVSTGLYTIARAEELATSVRKIGFALTRGASAIEISGDVPHEITETEGQEIRYIADKQGLDILFHGSLTVPLDMPERGEWRDAHDHMQKSIRSAVFCGSKYVNFHICLNIWLELMTYAGRKLTMAFCDHEGNFISKILKESAKLREWFVQNRWDVYHNDVLSHDEKIRASTKAEIELTTWRKEELLKRLSKENVPRDIIDYILVHDVLPSLPPQLRGLEKKIKAVLESIRTEIGPKSAELQKKYIQAAMREKLEKGLPWDSEELRATVGIVDGALILANYVFFSKDPIWTEMARLYSNVLAKYKLSTEDINSLDEAWKAAERNNDKKFKEFFYGVVGAKLVEGHTKKILKWINEELIAKELKGKPELQKIASQIAITYESPDARDPGHAGLHMLWSPRQMYAAVKTIRKTVGTDRVWMLMDFEHVATQGIDPIKDMEEVIKLAPDFGKYVLSVHSNAPNPLHAHEPLELGDIRIYQLLWFLRKTGFGKDRKVYLIFERGGAKDPFAQSVEVLKLAAQFLEKDIEPKNLPIEYFGMKGPTAGGFERQVQIIRDHAWEPLKDLLEMPEEEWTFLSQAAIKKGKRPEVWKRAEFR